ncbi:MAG: long-chain fatty acid--CoA ligase, partial [Gammaproteobacteria bacterium]|nr:long-chain fatty acid--CoA ligase [Gammaproteobacteria bacterium]
MFDQMGLQRGERVALCGRNSSNWGVAYLAAITYGAVIVPILPDFTAAEIEHIVRHSECSVLLAADNIYDRLNDDKMPSLKAILRLRDLSVFFCPDKKLGEALA